MISKLFKRAPISLSISGVLLVLFLLDSLMVQIFGSRALDQFLVFHTSKPLQIHRYLTYDFVTISFTHFFYSVIFLIMLGYLVENKMSKWLKISSALVSIISLPLLSLIFHGLDSIVIAGNSAVSYGWSGILFILIFKRADLFPKIDLILAIIYVFFITLSYLHHLYYLIISEDSSSLAHYGLIIAVFTAWGSTRLWNNQLQLQTSS